MEKRKRKDYIKGYHKKGLIEKITYNCPCGNGEILEYVKYWENLKSVCLFVVRSATKSIMLKLMTKRTGIYILNIKSS